MMVRAEEGAGSGSVDGCLAWVDRGGAGRELDLALLAFLVEAVEEVAVDVDGCASAEGDGDGIAGAAVDGVGAGFCAQVEVGVVGAAAHVCYDDALYLGVGGIEDENDEVVGEGAGRLLSLEVHADCGGLSDADPDEDGALACVLAENDDGGALPVEGNGFYFELDGAHWLDGSGAALGPGVASG